MTAGPAFGHADLTNCEREQIHLAGSIQPHGVLLVLREHDGLIVQASDNTRRWWGCDAESLLGQPLSMLGGDIARRTAEQRASLPADGTHPFRCATTLGGERALEAVAHLRDGGLLVLELASREAVDATADTVDLDAERIGAALTDAVKRCSAASTIGALADVAARTVRELTGHDRVMVYKFDPDGHGKIIAEARDPRLESLLGHHYPASDIPQRARELYLRNRVRVLVDVAYRPAPLVPRLLPDGQELDMSHCHLRSMSPLHLQYLKNMGVTATLVVSLVREGRLWGLIAAHHDTPRDLRFAVRAATDLLAEVFSTRIAAIENYAQAQVAILVRRLEQRLVDATSTEGDWRLALFRNPHTLLQPLEATGAALFQDDEVLVTGEVPSTPELRALRAWVDGQRGTQPFACSSVGKAEPALVSLTPTASGVLAVRLSATRPDYLMWFRKEQLLTVTWAGDPHKQMVGSDPLELSPRRSFAAWSEIVRGTALPWTGAEIALARAVGSALVDIIVQVNAVRLLIAEQQIAQTRGMVHGSKEPVLVVDGTGRVLFVNTAFRALLARPDAALASIDDIAALFAPVPSPHALLDTLVHARQPWRGELALARPGDTALPVGVRAEAVPGRDGRPLGVIVMLQDLSDSKRAEAARSHLEQSLAVVAGASGAPGVPAAGGAGGASRDVDEVVQGILANASLAAMDIADATGEPSIAPMLEEVEASTERATALYRLIRHFADRG